MSAFSDPRSLVTDTSSSCLDGCIQATSRTPILGNPGNPFEAGRLGICVGLWSNQHIRHIGDEPLCWDDACPSVQQAGDSIPHLLAQQLQRETNERDIGTLAKPGIIEATSCQWHSNVNARLRTQA